MGKFIWIIVIVAVLGTAGGLVWWFSRSTGEPTELVLYGNVDLRQVQLAFNNSERIAEVNKEEGDRVRKGDIMAKLDTNRLKPMVAQAEAQAAQAEAQVAAQYEVFKRLAAGNRPEEKAQARANVASAKANVESARAERLNALENFERFEKLVKVKLKDQTEVRAVSKEDFDKAKAALDKARAAFEVADANLMVSQKALDLSLLGPRKEEVDEAEARLRANKDGLRANRAQLVFLKQQLADADLVAPVNAVVRTRLMEPGEMATPQKAVFSLAVVDPKWVRAYVSETNLGKVHMGMKAFVTVDSFPDKRFEGTVGFISSVAEFTPKSVQTVELRTSLVYEIRVWVQDPGDQLRLGMPATVHVPLQAEK